MICRGILLHCDIGHASWLPTSVEKAVAMAKKLGLRKIMIEGAAYHWKAEWFYIGRTRIIRLRVWGDDKSSRPLEVLLTSRMAATWPLRHIYDTDGSYVLPHQVKAIILYARTRGWQPQTRGCPFFLGVEDLVDVGDLTVVEIKEGVVYGIGI